EDVHTDLPEFLPWVGLLDPPTSFEGRAIRPGPKEPDVVDAEVPAEVIQMQEAADVLPVDVEVRDAPGAGAGDVVDRCVRDDPVAVQDRKSTRLNSSHRTISYAV